MKIRSWAVGSAVALLAFVLLLIGTWRLSRSRSLQLVGELVTHVETDSMVVALTFDDGPSPTGTRPILDMADSLGFRGTFFVTGAELSRDIELGRLIVERGHELGNHTFTHSRMVFRSPAFVRNEVESTDSLIREAGERDPIFFRPPYASRLLTLPLYLARHDRPLVLWDVEPDSYPEIAEEADRITEYVLDRVRPGSIILLHVMYPSRETSLAAVPGIVSGLRERGYRLVTLGELMSYR